VQTPCRSEFDVSGGEMVLAVCVASQPQPTPVEPIATTATLQVRGTPAGAEVYVDGHLKGKVPCDVTVHLDEQKQREVEVVIKEEGYKSAAVRMTLQRGKTAVWRA